MQQQDHSHTSLYFEMRSDLACYTSIIHVLDKLERETQLNKVSHLFNVMIKNEITFAIQGKISRAQEAREHQGPALRRAAHQSGDL